MKVVNFLCWLFLAHLVESLEPPKYNSAVDNGARGSYPTRKCISSKLRAPDVNFLHWSQDCDDGLFYFIAPRGWKVPDPGPMILDGAGNLVWSKHFANEFGGQAYDLKVQKYRGEDHLTFWLGDDTVRGHGAGHYYVLNSSYDVVHKIGAANGMYADLHELIITPESTALMIIFQPIKADVRPLGRKFSDLWNQAIWDCLFQEIDLDTNDVVFEWRASEHLNMSHAYNELDSMGDLGTQDNPFDPFHLNSVEKDDLGNYLVSARNPHAIYYVDGKSKDVIWTLGGKGNTFQDLSNGRALSFAWQHDARFVSPQAFPETYALPMSHPGVTTRLLTLFDNAAVDWNYFYGFPYSRGLLVELTYPTPGSNGNIDINEPNPTSPVSSETGYSGPPAVLSKQDQAKVAHVNGTNPAYKVRVIREFINPEHVRSSNQGSLQLLPQQPGKDHKILIGYGINAVITEYSSITLMCNMHFGAKTSWEKADVESYRAYKFPWIGRPREPPWARIYRGRVYVSWNGATQVRMWRLEVSVTREENDWRDAFKVAKEGFETSMPLQESTVRMTARYIRVVALDSSGELCEYGVSNVVDRGYLNVSIRESAGKSVVLFCVGSGAVVVLMYKFTRRLTGRRSRARFRDGLLSGQRDD